jgi:hypothetical protein
MKILYKLIYLLLLQISYISLANQTQYSSYEGTHFYVGFMQNEIVIDPRYGGLHLKLFIFPSSTTDITVVFPNDSVVTFSNVSPSQNLEINVPTSFENFESEVVRKKAVEIISTNPILVYGFSSQYLTSDAYTAIPVEKWGTEYVAISIANDQYTIPPDVVLDPADSIYRKTPRQSEFLILSAYDSTQITFYPKAITEKGVQVNNPKTITLNKGETYLVKSFPFDKGYGDLSGTLIRGNKPFGVISGHVRTAIPQNLVPKWDSKNHLCEMLMPTNSWGREFITVPFGTSPYGDLIKITSYFPNTTITAVSSAGSNTYVLNNNFDVLEIPFVAEPVKWISDKPIQMAQFIMHSGSEWDSPNYDPAMTLVPPVEQFVTNVTFQTPANIQWNPAQFVAHFVNIIGTIDALDQTYLNGVRLVDFTNNIYLFKLFNDTYFWANVQIPYGRYQIKTYKGKIAGIVYGVGLADAYALVLGSSLVNPYIGDSIPPELSYSAECGNLSGYFYETKVEPNTGINYLYVIVDSTFNFTYQLSTIKDTTTYAYFSAKVIDPYKKGKIVIEARDRNGNSKRLSYTYEPPNISFPNELVFSQVKPNDTLRKTILIKNNGSSINILNISFAQNEQRLSWYVNRKLPFTLALNDTCSIFVTLTPGGNIQPLFDTLIVEVDCNLTFRIPIVVSFLNWEFIAFGYDFGKVYIGDTALGRVGIVNRSALPISFDTLQIGTYPNIYTILKNRRFTLKSGDTAFFDVKFVPVERRDYQSFVVFNDELKVRPQAEIKGTGVAPLIEPVRVDFGKVRLGRAKDTLIYLVNTGNIDATIDFQNFGAYDPDFKGDFSLQSVRFIDSLPISISFRPSTIGRKSLTAYYKVDWKLHPLVSLEVLGEGVLPGIETYDVDFDTIFVDETLQKNATIVASKGNENLYIKEILPSSGDINSFEIDYSKLRDLILPPDSLLTIPITFKPSFVGYHQMELLVFSDATLSDTFVVSKIKISGFARSRDTLNANLIFKYLVPEYACTSFKLDFSIENTGNISFPITGMRFDYTNFEMISGDTALTQKVLAPGETIDGYIVGVPKTSGKVIMKITIYYGEKGDSVVFNEVEFNILKLQQTLSLETGTVLRVGDKSNLVVRGSFPKPTDVPFDMVLEIQSHNPRQILFDNTVVDFKFKDSKKEWTVPSVADFKGNFVHFECKNIQLAEENTQWEITLPFQIFLTDEQTAVFSGKLYENDCFVEANNTTQSSIEPFCVYPLRDIELVDGAVFLNYYPQPIEDFLMLEFTSLKKDFIFYEIFDNLGNMVVDKKIIELFSGSNKEKVDFSFLENGIYFVKLYFENRTKQIMVIKLK